MQTAFACGVTNVDLATTEAFFVDPHDAIAVVPSETYTVRRLDPQTPADASRYVDAVRASSAFPVMLDPILVADGEPNGASYAYIDGGVADNTTLTVAHRLGATEILAVFVDGLRTVPRRPRNVGDIFVSMQIANQSQLDRVQAAYVAEDGNALSAARVYAIRPDPELPLNAYDFRDQAALDGAFARGREDGRRGPVGFDRSA